MCLHLEGLNFSQQRCSGEIARVFREIYLQVDFFLMLLIDGAIKNFSF